MASLFTPGVRKPLKCRRKCAKSGLYINGLEWLAGEPGFEPGLTESESVGLPLTYSPASAVMNRAGRAAKPLERCLVAASGK